MGIFDAFRRTPTPGATPTTFGRGHFAVQRIDIGVRPDKATRRGVSHPRAPEAWAAYRSIGEVGFVVDFFANQLRRIRLYPAVEPDDPKDGRVLLDPEDTNTLRDLQVSPEVAAQAATELDRVRGENGSLGEILADMAVAYKVPGDGHLVATVDDDNGEVWQVLSSRALVAHQGRWVIRRTQGDKGTPLNPDTDFVGRFWRRDPEWPGQAFSDLTRILDHAEGLQLISQSMRNASRSRTAGAGALFFDAAADLGGKGHKGTGTIKDPDFYDDLQEYLAAPVRDPGSVAAFAPFVADIVVPPGKSVADMMHLQTFDRPLTEIELKREETLIHRIAFGLDAPPELITGYASLNHWTAWMVKDETYQAHIEPLAVRIADTIAALVVRPALRAAGVPAPIVDRITVGVDASDLIARPDPGKDADDAHDRLTISDKSYRQRKGFDESDAPTDEEVQRRLEWQALRRGRTSAPSTAPSSSGEESRGETLPDTEPGTDGADDEARTASALLAAADSPDAARVAGLGDRLARLDQSLQDRVLAAADAAVRRALERALNRTRNRARRTPHADQLAALTPLRIHEAAPVMEALGITDLDLVTEGDFEELEDQWMAWVAGAQATMLAEYEGLGLTLIDDERQRLEAEQETDRGAGWATLLALLLALTRSRLTSADPTGDDEQTVEETLGEITEGVLVPAGVARQALSVAGGATSGAQTTPGGAVLLDAGTRPAGGVATGVQSLRLASDAGLTVTGWRWVHGLPTVPFEPHARLDGQVFQTWQDPVLAADPAQWPHVSFYTPGDHRGCTCGSAPQLTLTDPVSAN